MRLKLAAACALLTATMSAHAIPIIQGNTLLTSDVIYQYVADNRAATYEDAAKLITKVYEAHGFLGIKTRMDRNIITILEPTAKVEGAYNNTWVGLPKGRVLEVATLSNSMAMADAENRFQRLDVEIGDLNWDGTVDVYTDTEDLKPYKASINYNTYGQDASSRDLVTLSGATHLGEGFRLDASLTRGLAEMRKESKSGKLQNGYGSIRKATVVGEFSASWMKSENQVGGEEASIYDYQLAGNTDRYSFSHHYHFAGIGKLTNTFSQIHREQDFGLFNLTDEQDYKTWSGRYQADFGTNSFTLSVTKGLSGSREHNLLPLLGTFNEKFYSVQMDFTRSDQFANNMLAYNLALSGFQGSADMPSAERMSLGGPGRGSAYGAGVISGYKGFVGDARLYLLPSLSPVDEVLVRSYVSVNGGTITDAIENKFSLASAEFGLVGRWREITASATIARSIGGDLPDEQRFNFSLSYDL